MVHRSENRRGSRMPVMHMKNVLIQKAIEEFKNKRLGVYKVDLDQIVRDTRVAERTTKDHVGRWLFELLQNSDDAKASEVRIVIDKDTIYVADNGNCFKPEALSAICGTDFSDKTTGTIGRKGLGFKSVYEVSQNPQVLTLDGEGVEFNPEKTKAWLRENGLNDGHVPYQWIPFFIPWGDARSQDPHLSDFEANAFKTIIRLPGLSQENKQKVEQLLLDWPPHALFAFRHLRKIKAPRIEVVLTAGDGVWSLHDSRGQTPVEWRVAKHTEFPPADLLQILGADERKAIETEGVSFLIAAPLDSGCVLPTSEYLPVHVFYPTEQKGPVRLLLHAEFIVKSDRTALIPVDGNLFNAWVADRLAYYVCKFVNDSYYPASPNKHVALLVPFADRTSHPVAESLWQRIANEAKKYLRLADVEGFQRLSLEESRLISVSVRPDLARTILVATSIRGQLLHSSFDDDKEAHKALRELGCKEIDDQDLMTAIAENADSLAANKEWVWACWEWLADWVAKKPYGEEHRQRIERASSLPVVPVNGSLKKASDLAGRIVTWKPDADVGNLPEWLPLTFVEDWFRDSILNEINQESPIKNLCKELRIEEPRADVIQRAVGRAVEQFWKDKKGDPGRFLRFILEQDWHETGEASDELKRCPLRLTQPVDGETWAEARKTYFGREWGNDLLAALYKGIGGVAWVENNSSVTDRDKQRRVLEWLGVAHCPRILDEWKEVFSWNLPEGCGKWKQYLNTARGYEGRLVERIATVSKLEHLEIENLDAAHGVLLIRLLSQNWMGYYHSRAEVTAEGSLFRERYYRSWRVRAKWWWEICESLTLPKLGESDDHIALTKLWLPDKRTERAIGSLLPVIDLNAFESDKDAVREWLISAVGLRTRIEQVTIEEWKEFLTKQIPDKASVDCLAQEERLRDKVTGWYVACLDTVAEQEDVSEKAFVSCPLLCRKGSDWQYVAGEPRYLDDENELATAFAEDVWIFHIPTRIADAAVKYFGVLRLSHSVEVNVAAGEPQSPLSGELNVRFSESLPYVWAWRLSQSKQVADSLAGYLKSLEVLIVPVLEATLSLDGLSHKVERRWYVKDHTIYLCKDYANESELAQALAKALDVRSEADFYENLLRCTDDRQRKEKLLSKGMSDVEINRCLREYSGSPAEVEQDESGEQTTKGKKGSSSSQVPPGGGSQGQQRKLTSTAQPDETSGGTSLVSPENGEKPLRLKDSSRTSYVLGTPPIEGGGTGGSGEGGCSERERYSPTNEEKEELEKAGRTVAKRELERLGYTVKEMPPSNPGFDLLATREGEKLRVEVKAHSGRATVVDITQREYIEYLRQQGYRWELWNVEHLTEGDPNQVVITRYDQIPDDALDARTFRVDLKKCQGKLQD